MRVGAAALQQRALEQIIRLMAVLVVTVAVVEAIGLVETLALIQRPAQQTQAAVVVTVVQAAQA
jgi:hypothetical protein